MDLQPIVHHIMSVSYYLANDNTQNVLVYLFVGCRRTVELIKLLRALAESSARRKRFEGHSDDKV